MSDQDPSQPQGIPDLDKVSELPTAMSAEQELIVQAAQNIAPTLATSEPSTEFDAPLVPPVEILAADPPVEAAVQPAVEAAPAGQPAVPDVTQPEITRDTVTRPLPDAYYTWNGENITLGFSYLDFYKDAREITKFSDIGTKDRHDLGYAPSYHPALIDADEYEQLLNAIPKTENGQRWRALVQMGLNSLQRDTENKMTQGLRALTRPGSDWRSRLDTQKGAVGFASPKIADPDSPTLTGRAARYRMRALMGHGPELQIPLVHSGFWVSVSAPSNGLLINLYEQLTQTKIELGRNTHGLVYSAQSAFSIKIVLDLLRDHIHDTTLKLEPDQDILDYIKVTDLDMLLTGWARVIWPKGYNLVRSELTPEGAASGKMISGIVDLARMVIIDNTPFTDWMKSHIANRNSRAYGIPDIERYQREIGIWQGKEVAMTGLSDQIKLQLRVPSVKQYVTSSTRWVNSLVELVESTLTSAGSEELKNRQINQQSLANSARQYSHWIEKIDLGDRAVLDPESIDELVDDLSGEDVFNDHFYKGIKDYRDDCSVVMVGIPEPKFQEVNDNKRFARWIPIDPLSHFFSLLASRSMKVTG